MSWSASSFQEPRFSNPDPDPIPVPVPVGCGCKKNKKKIIPETVESPPETPTRQESVPEIPVEPETDGEPEPPNEKPNQEGDDLFDDIRSSIALTLQPSKIHSHHHHVPISHSSYFPHETRSRNQMHHAHSHHGRESTRSHDALRHSDGLLAHFEDPNHPLFHHGNDQIRNTTASQHQHHHHHHHHHHHESHHGHAPIVEEIFLRNTIMLTENINSYREARKIIVDLQETNIHNDQIILFFLASKDVRGQVWNNDCHIAERAVSFLIKKIEAGGHLLKIHVGSRKAWMNPKNPWRRDPKYKITSLPTLMVCNTYKRLNGKRVFDMEALISLFQD